jgi:hypothetical protein
MPKYNTIVEVSGINDSTLAMQGEIEYRVGQYHGPKAAANVHETLKPFLEDTTEAFLTEARKLVHIINVVTDDSDEFDRQHDDDLTQFDLHDFDFRGDY